MVLDASFDVLSLARYSAVLPLLAFRWRRRLCAACCASVSGGEGGARQQQERSLTHRSRMMSECPKLAAYISAVHPLYEGGSNAGQQQRRRHEAAARAEQQQAADAPRRGLR